MREWLPETSLPTRASVYLVEKDEEVGGLVKEHRTVNFDHTPGAKILKEYESKITGNENIELMLNSEVVEAMGAIGDFAVVVKTGKKKQKLKVGVVIVATGAVQLEEKGLYGLHKLPEVMTQLEFNSRLATEGGLQRGRNLCSHSLCRIA